MKHIYLMLLVATLGCSVEPAAQDRATVIQYSATGDTLSICTDAHHVWRVDSGVWFYCGAGEREFVSGTVHIKSNAGR